MPEQSPSARYWPAWLALAQVLAPHEELVGIGERARVAVGRRRRAHDQRAGRQQAPEALHLVAGEPRRRQHRRGVPQRLEVGRLDETAFIDHFLELVGVGQQQEPHVGERAGQASRGRPRAGSRRRPPAVAGVPSTSMLAIADTTGPAPGSARRASTSGRKYSTSSPIARRPACSATGSPCVPRCIAHSERRTTATSSAGRSRIASQQLDRESQREVGAQIGIAARRHPADQLLGQPGRVRVDPAGMGDEHGQATRPGPDRDRGCRTTIASSGSRSWRRPGTPT